MFGQDAVLPTLMENLTWNTTNWIQGIDDTASLITTRARLLEGWSKDIDVAIQNLKESRDANKHYFDEAADLHTEDRQMSDFALMYETKIEQSHSAKLDARWQGPYWITDIAQNLGTYQLAELDGAELMGWIDGCRRKKLLTRNESVHGTQEIKMPSTTQEKESEEFKEFKVEAVAGSNYIERRWMYLVKLKDWHKWLWVWVEDMAGSKDEVEKLNSAHPLPADHSSKQRCERWMHEEGQWKEGEKGGDPLH